MTIIHVMYNETSLNKGCIMVFRLVKHKTFDATFVTFRLYKHCIHYVPIKVGSDYW